MYYEHAALMVVGARDAIHSNWRLAETDKEWSIICRPNQDDLIETAEILIQYSLDLMTGRPHDCVWYHRIM